MYKSLNLLEPMDEVISVIGEPKKGNGWYGHTNGLLTFSISVQNFQGRVSVQGSIVNSPSSDADWFTVLPGGVPYIQYPRLSYVVMSPSMGETSLIGFNYIANLIWLRASVDRSYIIPLSPQTPYQSYQQMFIATFGLVNQILVNY